MPAVVSNEEAPALEVGAINNDLAINLTRDDRLGHLHVPTPGDTTLKSARGDRCIDIGLGQFTRQIPNEDTHSGCAGEIYASARDRCGALRASPSLRSSSRATTHPPRLT